MKIALASDIHLEFGDLLLKNEENAEVLILSGDICTAKVFKHKPKERAKVRDFFKRCSFQFPHVVYVMGNHEHYDFDIAKTYDRLKFELSPFENIHLLEKETWEHNGITFVGGTLWTDMNKNDPLTLWHVGQRMNDFRLITNSNRKTYHKNVIYANDPNNSNMRLKDSDGNLVVERVDHYEKSSRWSVEDSVEDHNKMLDYIKIATADYGGKPKKFVVVTHHAPTALSIAECYKGDTLMNGAFQSNLIDFILDKPQIKLWTHGHMHNVSNYMIGETRVVCNPRGYIGHEQRALNFELKYFEI
jgi:Icc-related predicted phosphoesterase